MKYFHGSLTAILITVLVATNCTKAKDDTKFEISQFRNPTVEFRSKPFWSLNDSLSKEEMRWQLESFKEAGYGGAFLHSRIGLLTPYLSDEWFDLMDAGVKYCQELGIEAWFYDEDKWPSGFAGGIIPRMSDSYRAHTLLRIPAGTEINPEDKILYQDDQYIYVDFLDRMGQSWFNGTCWVDLMNPEMVKAFLDCSYEPYVRRYAGQDMVRGIFSDEPQVSPKAGDYNGSDASLPYSPCMEKPFKDMWGYDLDTVLPSLIDTVGDWRTVRLHYYRTVAHCLETAFSAQIGDYCADNGFIWCGHYNGEEMSSANMKNEGNLQRQLRHMNMPGVDALGLKYKNNHNDKVMTSTANQYGQKRRLVEIFGISGHNLSFEDRMWVTAWHTNMGANFMCPHLSLYSAKGERKRDFPPTFSYHQPYFSENRLFEDFSARLCYFATVGKTTAEACVLSTIESDYILNGPKPVEYGESTYDQTEEIINTALKRHLNIDIADEQFIEEIGSVSDGKFSVGKMGYSTVIVPQLYTIRPSTIEKLVEFGKEGGRIIVIGDYPPFVEGVRNPEAIESLRSQSILVSDCKDALMAALPESEGLRIEGEDAAKVMTHLREIKDGSSAQISNTSKSETVRVKVGFKSIPSSNVTVLLNPLNGEVLSVPETTFELELAPAQSYVLLNCRKKDVGKTDKEYVLPASLKALSELPMEMKGRRLGPNALPLDFAQFSKDGGQTWSDEEPVLAFYKRSQTENWNGPLKIRYSFNVETVPAKSAIAIEQPWIYDSIEINGANLDKWGHDYFIDKDFRSHDVSGFVKEGRNTVTLSINYVSPLTKDSDPVKRYGTEIETIYFIGDFAVKGIPAKEQLTTTWRNNFPRLEKKPIPTRFEKSSIAIAKEDSTFNGNLTEEGYAFFCGSFELSSTFALPVKEEGKHYRICFPEAETILLRVSVNGTEYPVLYCSPWNVDVTDALQQGKNEVKLTLTGSLRNIFGPYHNIGGEFNAVGPDTFSGGPDWPNVIPGDKDWYEKRKTGKAILWRDDYFCIPFGLLKAPILAIEE